MWTACGLSLSQAVGQGPGTEGGRKRREGREGREGRRDRGRKR